MRRALVALPFVVAVASGCSGPGYDPLAGGPCAFLDAEQQEEIGLVGTLTEPGRCQYVLPLIDRMTLEAVIVTFVEQPIDVLAAEQRLVPTADFGELVQYRNTASLVGQRNAVCLLAGRLEDRSTLVIELQVTAGFSRVRDTDPCSLAVDSTREGILAERLGV